MLEADNTKPNTVHKAVQILYAVLIIGVVRSIIEFPRLVEQSANAGLSAEFLIGFQVLTLSLSWLLIFLIGRRKNWARYFMSVGFILVCPFSIMPLIQSLANEPISGLLGIIQVIAQAIALILLFKAPSREWFKKPSKQQTLD